ncbi:MAG TPA: hypothetical protein VF944_11615 [Candidatus Bathyarchaeia archaeon]
MKDQFNTYLLKELQQGQAVIDRVKYFHDAYTHLLPEPIDDLLLADYFLADGTREFDELWFFTSHFVGLVTNFLSVESPRLEVFNFVGRIFYYRLEPIEYDLRFPPPGEESAEPRQSGPNARLTLTFGYYTGIGEGSIRAAAGNCDALHTIILKYFRRWLVDLGTATGVA